MFFPSNLFCQDLKNASVSVDPFTFLGMTLFFMSFGNDNQEEAQEINFNNIWFSMDSNWVTGNNREVGVGLFLGSHKINLKTQYRFFYNKEKQSGIFWGLYGLIEWRRMYWYYGDNNEITIGWDFPFSGRDTVYHSLGITGGIDTGFRFRKDNFGITPFIGLGYPLFYCFGNLPSKDKRDFKLLNMGIRAINIGVKLDFFND